MFNFSFYLFFSALCDKLTKLKINKTNTPFKRMRQKQMIAAMQAAWIMSAIYRRGRTTDDCKLVRTNGKVLRSTRSGIC